jgi:hypothetical protein
MGSQRSKLSTRERLARIELSNVPNVPDAGIRFPYGGNSPGGKPEWRLEQVEPS